MGETSIIYIWTKLFLRTSGGRYFDKRDKNDSNNNGENYKNVFYDFDGNISNSNMQYFKKKCQYKCVF